MCGCISTDCPYFYCDSCRTRNYEDQLQIYIASMCPVDAANTIDEAVDALRAVIFDNNCRREWGVCIPCFTRQKECFHCTRKIRHDNIVFWDIRVDNEYEIGWESIYTFCACHVCEKLISRNPLLSKVPIV